MNRKGRWTAVLLAGALALTAAGCSGGGDSTWVYELDGEKLAAGVYLNYMLDAYAEAESKYQEKANEEGKDLSKGIKPATVFKEEIEGQAGDKWISHRAQQFVMQSYGVADQFASENLTLSLEEMEQVTTGTNSMWQIGKDFYEANGISEESLRAYFTSQKRKESLFLHLYGKEGKTPVSEQELKDALKTNYVKAEYIRISKQVAAEGEEASDNAAVKAQAEGYLARLKSGEPMEDIAFEYQKSIAPEGQEVTKPEKGSNSTILSLKEANNYGKLGEGFQTVQMGEPILIEDEYEFYILNRLDIDKDPADLDQYYSKLLGDIKYEAYLSDMEAAGRAKNPVANETALSRYTAGKLDLNYQKYFKAPM